MEPGRLDSYILLGALLIALWASSQFGQLLGQSETASVANTYSFMALIVLVMSLAAASNFSFFRFTGVNNTGNSLIPLLILGGIVGFFSTSQGRALIAPVIPASIDPTLSAAFVLLLAPFVEEYFFRGFLFPTFEAALSSAGFLAVILAAIIQAALFAVFHVVAYGNTPAAFMPLFIFAIVQAGLVKLSRSIAPALSSHFVLNLITRG